MKGFEWLDGCSDYEVGVSGFCRHYVYSDMLGFPSVCDERATEDITEDCPYHGDLTAEEV
jgi:hypothetical protein